MILIQRGKGGGLAGAFGGMGGSSAFGARTGDVFTKVTVGVAIAWILLSMLMVVLTNRKPAIRLGRLRPPRPRTDSEPRIPSGSPRIQRHGSTLEAMPEPLGSALPADVKVLTELPDPLEGPLIPPKKQ